VGEGAMVKKKASRMPDESDIVHYSLQGLLPAECVLAINKRLGTLALLAVEGSSARMVVEQQCTGQELDLFLVLVESYPYFAPYEALVTAFLWSYEGMSEEKVARCRAQLQQAQDAGTWDYEMRPVRNALSRLRLKLAFFGLTASSIIETGYMLAAVRRRPNEGV
jgi:hypothetical protein